MIVFQHEPPIIVSGRAFVAVTRIKLMRHVQNGALLIAGDKRAVAVICSAEGSEEIFGVDGARMDAAALRALIADQTV